MSVAPAPAGDPRFAAPRTLFFGIGAQKSATTWLDQYLREHPEVCLPALKEVHYWTALAAPGGAWEAKVAVEMARIGRQSLARRLLRPAEDKVRDEAWRRMAVMFRGRTRGHAAYADVLFQRYRGEPVTGEITPNYAVLDADTFRQMAALGPDVRFLFVMRDPVARLISGLKHGLRYRKETVTSATLLASLKAALDDPGHAAMRLSRYDVTISRLEAVASAGSVFYLFYETMFRQSEMDRLTDFLGIAHMPASFDREINVDADRSLPAPEVAAATERAYDALRPTYDYVDARFGAPEAWGLAAARGAQRTAETVGA